MPRAAVIGMGNAGLRHREAYHQAGIATTSIEKGQHWKTAVEWADIVSICTPDDLHCEMTCFALEHGKHVLCEKPLTHSMDELEKIEAFVHLHDGQTFGTNFPLRHVVTRDGPGTIHPYVIDAAYEHGRKESYLTNWRAKMAGYSLMCGGGIHLVDLVIRNNPMPVRGVTAVFDIRQDGPPIFQSGHFTIGSVAVRVTANFTFDGPHRAWAMAYQPSGPILLLDQTDEPYDKLADIRQFIADVEHDNPGNGADAIRANRICIEMSHQSSIARSA